MLKPGLMRFILAMLVLLYHITKVVFIGHFAVLCFFMLSGYWITFMYENKYSKIENKLKTFYTSRVWRLFPVFLLFNVLAFVACFYFRPEVLQMIKELTFSKQVSFWLSNVFLIGLNQARPAVLGPAWSLDIEMQFYVVYPLLFFLTKKTNYWIVLIFLLITLILSVFFPVSYVAKTLIYYTAFFLIGILIYLKQITFKKSTEVFYFVLFVLILLSCYIFPDLKKVTVTNNLTDFNRYLNELLPFLLIPLISNSVRNKSSKLDRILGDMSFVIYLCHWVLIMPYNYYIKGLSFSQRIPYSIMYIIATLFFGYLFYRFYDKPIDSLRRKWVEAQSVKKDAGVVVPLKD